MKLAESYAAGEARSRISSPLSTLGIELDITKDQVTLYASAASKFTCWISTHVDANHNLNHAQRLIAQSTLLMICCNVFTNNRNVNFELTCLSASLQFFPLVENMKEPMLAANLHKHFGTNHPDTERDLGMAVVKWVAFPNPDNLAIVCSNFVKVAKLGAPDVQEDN